MKSLTKYIYAHALKNSLEHGSAVEGKILPKLFAHGLEKSQIKSIMPEIKKIIEEVNSLSEEEKKSMIEEYKEFLPERHVRPENYLPELKDIKNLVMRFEPSPSGPLHVGHSYVLTLNAEYVKRHGGKLILRIADTNPENIYPPTYKLIPEDANWLTQDTISEIIIQSDRIPIYYKYAEKLLDLNKLYICTCESESYKELLNKSKACPCRELPKEEQKSRWEKMFSTYKQGEAVVRLKTNLKDKNPAMRDFPLFRINETPHPRQKKKFRIWPLMNIAVTVDDIESKITHIIRAKDHADNAKRQAIIYSYLNLKSPETMFVGRINFLGMPLSTTETRKAIERKKYSGWDDIRLPTLLALKRRGFTPQALVKYALGVGITLTDKTVSKEEFFKSIEAFNRQIIDSTADRYSFIHKPIELKILNAPKISSVKVPVHPDKKEQKTIKVGKIFISENDFEKFKGEEIRLLHLYNVKLHAKSHNAEYTSKENKNIQKINWVSSFVPTQILLPTGEKIQGIAEESIKTLKYNEIVQFERFGFAKLDKRGKKHEFWFTHK